MKLYARVRFHFGSRFEGVQSTVVKKTGWQVCEATGHFVPIASMVVSANCQLDEI